MGSFRRHVRYRLWHLMVVVAIVALIAGGSVSLFPPDWHVHDYFMVINGHVFPGDSPAFWAILGFVLTFSIGLLVGFIALIVWATRAIRRGSVRKS